MCIRDSYNGPDAEPLRPADKFSEDGWLKTGDVGTISPDGFLTLTDRAKDVIKSGGEWISSVDLENALMSHPDVAEAAVVAVPDEKWGEAVTAVVVLRPGADNSEAAVAAMTTEIQSAVKERKGSVQSPKQVIVAETVPVTALGKPDKKAVRAQFWAGAARSVG